MKSRYLSIILFAFVLFLNGCAHFNQPKRKGQGWYLVKPSDTLFSVAWRYDIDFQKLAHWNQLKSPYNIVPGQYIRLIKPKFSRPEVVQPKVTLTKNTVKKIRIKPIKWAWPVKGNVLNKFSFNDINKRGIDIASKVGQPVSAVASGKVVYSGNGLAGYKNLIIIKHNETYLSAYANNKNLLVKEGDTVLSGKKIADMGFHQDSKSNKKYLLHFQIRKNGKPIDPIRMLSKK